MFPGIALLVLSAFCTGILNSHRQFFLSYVSPVMWNLGQITFVVAAGVWGASDVGIADALAWGVIVGAIVRGADPGAGRAAPHPRGPPQPRPLLPDVQNVLRRFGPVVVGRGVVQLLSYVDLVLASLLAVGAVSALTYGQVLYLLPISLFGMAVAAAELPELSRLGPPRAGRAHPSPPRRASTASPSTSRRSSALYLVAGDVIVGAAAAAGRVHGGGHAARVVRDRRLRPRPAGHHPVAAAAERALRPRPARSSSPASRCSASRSRPVSGALLMFPLDRLAIVGSSVQRIEDIGFGPLPDSVRLLTDGAPRLGVVGLALGAALSSWVEYRILRGALEWRIGKLPRMSAAARWSMLAARRVGRPGRRAAVHAPRTCPASPRRSSSSARRSPPTCSSRRRWPCPRPPRWWAGCGDARERRRRRRRRRRTPPGALARRPPPRPRAAGRRRPPQRRRSLPLLAGRGDRRGPRHAAGTRTTSPSRTGPPTSTSARSCATPTRSARRASRSWGDGDGTAAARW